MKAYLPKDIDSTVIESEPGKFDSPESHTTNFFWGDMDLYFLPDVLVKLINNSTMRISVNKYVLPDLVRNISIIKSFAKLPVNWNDNGAGQFTNRLINTAVKILRNLDYQPEVFPTARASILLEYGKPDGKFLGIEVFENRIETFIAPERETLIFALKDVAELRNKVNKFND